MNEQPQLPTSTRPRVAPWLVALGILILVALPLRVVDLGGFVIEDEARYWLDRSYIFLKALNDGDPAATAISTHPGVTTMWSGSIGTVIKRSFLTWGLLAEAPFPTTLALMRLPAALAHVAGILVGFWLLQRMLPLPVALLGALLWATDPLTLAYQRVLHVDGLMGTFATVSLLAASYYWHHRAALGWLLLSAVCGALAVLSKSPGLIVGPLVALIAVTTPLTTNATPGDYSVIWSPATWLRSLPSRIWPLLLWGGVFALSIVLVWPAVWANPQRVYDLMRIGVEVEGSSPHNLGNFFLGQRDDEPGWLFYPVAVALRLTPWAMVGLLLLPLVWHSAPLTRASRRDLLMLVVFALLFIVALSLFPKKLNRYMMPIFPALNILAAGGLVWGAALLGRLLRQQATRALEWLMVAVVGTVALVNVLWWHPYSVAYFNQALGGASAGPAAFLIGSGEGLEQTAAWLNAQPNITGVVVASTMTPPLQLYLKHGAQSLSSREGELPRATGYAVVYVRNVWNGALPPFDRFYQREPPLEVITLHGVDYAWIYEVPPPIEHELDVAFAIASSASSTPTALELRGYELDSSTLSQTNTISLTVQWYARTSLEQDYLMFAHILDSQGQRVGQIDAPPAGETPTSALEPGRHRTWIHPLPLTAELPPGDYWLALGLYEPASGARLPISGAPANSAAAPDAGGDALLLPFSLPGSP